jgi:LUD domain
MSTPSGSTSPEPKGTGPTEEARAEFGHLAPRGQLESVSEALERNGVTSFVVDSGPEAKRTVLSMLPIGAEVYNNTSRTLEVIGLAEEIERSGGFQSLRLRLYQMDHEMQRREMRQLSAAPDVVVGSAHAVTREGSILVASASGSQLGPVVSGAGSVILVVGGQKIVADLSAGLRRIDEFCFPLEDQRAWQAYGVPSGVNNVLIINRVVAPGRITVVLVNETLGF